MPVMCGSVTFRTAAIAIAASTALPPRLRMSRPVSDASGWLAPTTPPGRRPTERPAAAQENPWWGLAGDCAGPVAARPDEPAPPIADSPVDAARNARRLKLMLMAFLFFWRRHCRHRLQIRPQGLHLDVGHPLRVRQQ